MRNALQKSAKATNQTQKQAACKSIKKCLPLPFKTGNASRQSRPVSRAALHPAAALYQYYIGAQTNLQRSMGKFGCIMRGVDQGQVRSFARCVCICSRTHAWIDIQRHAPPARAGTRSLQFAPDMRSIIKLPGSRPPARRLKQCEAFVLGAMPPLMQIEQHVQL
jgi:hypothetical protein